MVRPFMCAVLALVLSTGVLLAEFIEGKVKSVDSDKNTITVTVNGKDKTFRVDEKVSVQSDFKDKRFTPLKDGLKAIKENDSVKLNRAPEASDNKDPVVTEIYVQTDKKTKKKKNK
jgi:hypothetical protein